MFVPLEYIAQVAVHSRSCLCHSNDLKPQGLQADHLGNTGVGIKPGLIYISLAYTQLAVNGVQRLGIQ